MYTHLQEIGSFISTLKEKKTQEISIMIKPKTWTFQWLALFCEEFQDVVLKRMSSFWEVFTLQPCKFRSGTSKSLGSLPQSFISGLKESSWDAKFCLALTRSAMLLLIKSPGHQIKSAGNHRAGKSEDASVFKVINFVQSNNWTMKDLSHCELQPGVFKVSANVWHILKYSASNSYFLVWENARMETKITSVKELDVDKVELPRKIKCLAPLQGTV